MSVKNPTISVIIATFNSGKLLPMVLDAVKKQTFPQDEIEILFLDGGSKDNTFEVAQQYGCLVINNPQTEPVYAKFLAFQHAQGHYAIYLDHDEVLENKESFTNRVDMFRENPEVKALSCTGYKNPAGYSLVNNYINEFGDPFSYFIYNLSKDANFFVPTMKKKYLVKKDSAHYTLFDFTGVQRLPIIELCAAAGMIDLQFFKSEIGVDRPDLIPHLFYLMLQKAPFLAISKNDTLVHYSSDNLQKYLNKIRWRVKNNVHFAQTMGQSGFLGRDQFQPWYIRNRKFLFLPYAYSLVFPLWDSLYLSLTRGKWLYLLHLPLTLFTANLIVYHSVLKLCGYKPQLKSYDESKTIKAN